VDVRQVSCEFVLFGVVVLAVADEEEKGHVTLVPRHLCRHPLRAGDINIAAQNLRGQCLRGEMRFFAWHNYTLARQQPFREIAAISDFNNFLTRVVSGGILTPNVSPDDHQHQRK
jgi:hypothetical protein